MYSSPTGWLSWQVRYSWSWMMLGSPSTFFNILASTTPKSGGFFLQISLIPVCGSSTREMP
ncbi:unnamed protein product [Periconia digitata]|uniref:Uncharacterized protein n=1 Tax=Periconia digitata TaxID=1303443 RepID=A0A9W4U9N3_9PLEO|nr:unnamed protein product [Periconia digitata]